MQVWGEVATGRVTEAEAEALDAALREHQAAVAQRPAGVLEQLAANLRSRKSKLAIGWPRRRPKRMPDREKSRQRARMLGGSSSMPPQVRAQYTECERAVLTVIAEEVKRTGACDLPIDAIAARAGVCRRTAQHAIAEAVRLGHIDRRERRRPDGRNDTNLIAVVSLEWKAWIQRGPVAPGCKVFAATTSIPLKKADDDFEHSLLKGRAPRHHRLE